jgi:hypothetical protein
MRPIQVSTFVFSAIWAARKEGEETENEILERLFRGSSQLDAVNRPTPPAPHLTGFHDARHGVVFPEGMEISRKYKGRIHRAVARNGAWYLDGKDRPFNSLNAMSREIASGPENAWANWFFVDQTNARRPISSLRNKSSVARKGLGLALTSQDEIEDQGVETIAMPQGSEREEIEMTWFQTIVEALRVLRGKAQLHEIYREVLALRRRKGLSTPVSLEAIVRRELENNSSDSENYTGHRDAFYLPEGKGAGVWALRPKYC